MLAWRLLPCAASTRENRQLLLAEPGTSCKGREPCRAPPAHRAQHACLDTEPRGTRRPTSDLDSALGFPSRRSGQCAWALRECDVRGGERARAQTVPGAVPCKMPALNFVCGFDLQEPSAQPRSRCAADILDLLYDVEGLNMCAPAPTSRASHARRLRARARHHLTLCVDPATARLQACAPAAAHANLVAAPAAA